MRCQLYYGGEINVNILFFTLGLLSGLLIFLLLNYCKPYRHKNIDKFRQQQDQLIAGLTEKKGAALKEIKEEEDAYRDELVEERAAAIKAIDEELAQAKTTYKIQKENLDRNLEEQQNFYEKRKFNLEKDYEKLQADYKNKEITDAANRKIELEKQIKDEQSTLHSSLAALQSDYKVKKDQLENEYNVYKENIEGRRTKLKEEIEDYEAKQKEIINRFKEDEAKRQQADFYRIKISEADKNDISKLKSLALSFSKPAVIYKVIWEVYYKAYAEALFKRVLGDNAQLGGIYKITNIQSQKVYVGRTTKLVERFRTHAKRGCGIDRINGLLYDEMMEQGLENFTWEIIEVCPKEEQSEKEKYWIKFYHSDEYGYNQNKGG